MTRLTAAVLVLLQGQIPPPRGYVSDFAGLLDGGAVARMDSSIADVQRRTGAEIAVVTLADLGGRSAADVAVRIGREWGVGARAGVSDPRRNLGVVILLKPLENGRPGTGELFIATGRGAEGVLPDARVGRIRDAMVPYLARQDYAGGLAVGVSLVAAALEEAVEGGNSAAGPTQATRDLPNPAVAFLVVLVLTLVVVAVLGGLAAHNGSRRRWPRRSAWIWMGGWPGGSRGGRGGGFGRGGFGGGFGGFGGGGGFSGGGAGGKF